jgi:hypothetical protein
MAATRVGVGVAASCAALIGGAMVMVPAATVVPAGTVVPAATVAPADVTPVKVAAMPLRIGSGEDFRWAVYGRGTDGRVWWRYTAVDGSALGGWRPIEGLVASGPDALRIDDGNYLLAARSTRGSLVLKSSSSESFPAGWTDLGGALTSAPDLAYLDAARAVFARGTDGAIWFRLSSGGSWGPWRYLGGQATSAPDAAGTYSSVLIQVRGTDGAIWQRSIDASGTPTSGWIRQPIITTSAPSAVMERDGGVRTWWRGDRGDLWTSRNEGDQERTSVGGVLTSAPGAAEGIRTGGTVPQVVVVRGSDGSVWIYSVGWSTWRGLGGQVT